MDTDEKLGESLKATFGVTVQDQVQASLLLADLPEYRQPRRRKKILYAVFSPLLGAVLVSLPSMFTNPAFWLKRWVGHPFAGEIALFCCASLLVMAIYAVGHYLRPFFLTRHYRAKHRERQKSHGTGGGSIFRVICTVTANGFRREYEGGSDLTEWNANDSLEETPALLILRRGKYGIVMPKRDLAVERLALWRSTIATHLRRAKADTVLEP